MEGVSDCVRQQCLFIWRRNRLLEDVLEIVIGEGRGGGEEEGEEGFASHSVGPVLESDIHTLLHTPHLFLSQNMRKILK